MDAYCCETKWDNQCVSECESEECGGCGVLLNCGDGECKEAEGENCGNCPQDCTCPEGSSCFQAECCSPDCEGKECGDDGCGGSCGECGEGTVCVENQCGPQNGCAAWDKPGCEGCACQSCVCDLDPYCCSEEGHWDSLCVTSCEEECGGCGILEACGDGNCDDVGMENCSSCPEDCKCKDNKKCFAGECCSADCEGKDCGPDGCGGECGECKMDSWCNNGKCEEGVCPPDCVGKECGPDGCGEECGECEEGKKCKEGLCIDQPICNDECKKGEHGCDGDDMWTCVEDADGCWYRKTIDCPGEPCFDGACPDIIPVVDVTDQPDVTVEPDGGGDDGGDDGGGDDGGCNAGGLPSGGLFFFLLLLGLLALPRMVRLEE